MRRRCGCRPLDRNGSVLEVRPQDVAVNVAQQAKNVLAGKAPMSVG